MKSPEGRNYIMGGKYLTIDPPSHLAMTHAWEDENGNPKFEMHIDIELIEENGRTTMHFEQRGFDTEVTRDDHAGGWGESFDKLAEHLASLPELADKEILNVRVVAATPEAVWKAWTNPECLSQWWGPKDFRNTFHQFDLKPGGVWKLTMHAPDGADYENEWRIVELLEPTRIVLDHDSQIHAFRLFATFESVEAGTRVNFRMRFENAEECIQLKSFLLEKNEENLDRLESILISI